MEDFDADGEVGASGGEDDASALHLEHHPHTFDFDCNNDTYNPQSHLSETQSGYATGTATTTSSSSNTNTDPNLEPYEGLEFDSEQAARVFYNAYARRIGFSTRVSVYQRSRRDASIIARQIVCSREGFRRRQPTQNATSKRQRTVTRVGCKAQMTVKKRGSGKWAVSKYVKHHNHELVPPDKVHCLRSHRHVSGPARSLIDTLQAAGMGPSGVMSVLIKESGGIKNVGFTRVDCQNYMSSSRHKTLGSGGRLIFDYLNQMREEDPGSTITYQVAKFGEDQKPQFVRFGVFEKKASCSCQMFVFSGIICRHILAVFRVTNVLTLPSDYILKRWTRNAKSRVMLDEKTLGLSSIPRESFAARYDNLRQQAINYVEQGVASAQIYKVAKDALHEATQKVGSAKKNGSTPDQSTLVNDSQQLQLYTLEQDKQIQELSAELEVASQRCEAYRVKLLSVLKDMEEQKLQISMKVQNLRLKLKD
ncbi:hypothetical protein Tsubulata_025698 [Turnera subulata]|uniref:Protein FAR1-RELATED SEQUENCE n=1 Tax=Turnera subulata TaxID=218843 RepID=A0A9Q0G0W5_9ROSI|nr:hypothetical protein Tsubulata_025698 [Turnera subulata]